MTAQGPHYSYCYGLHSNSEFFSVSDGHPVSRSLSATFSELTGQPTPLVFRVPIPTTAAPITGTIEMILLSVASSEPPQRVNPTLEISATATATAVDVAPLPTVTPPES